MHTLHVQDKFRHTIYTKTIHLNYACWRHQQRSTRDKIVPIPSVKHYSASKITVKNELPLPHHYMERQNSRIKLPFLIGLSGENIRRNEGKNNHTLAASSQGQLNFILLLCYHVLGLRLFVFSSTVVFLNYWRCGLRRSYFRR